jgi:molecular chaperone DnaK (HSP70)
MAASTDDGEVLVGEPAKRQSITHSENTDAMEVSG